MWTFTLLLACVDPGTATVPPMDSDPPPTVDSDPRLDLSALQLAVDAAAERNLGSGGVSLQVDLAGQTSFWGQAGLDARGGGPMGPRTAFEIASVTKLFTAVLILGMVRENRFELDDPIGPLLSHALPSDLLVIDGVDRAPDITVRQLLQHTSGLPDYWSDPPYVAPGVNAFLAAFLAAPDERWTASGILDYVPGLTPIHAPGEGWHYGDTNYVLLGRIAEVQLATPYHELLRQRVLEPLALHDTWMVWEETGPALTLSARYEGRRDLTRFPHQSADWAGGGLASTTSDLLTFSRAVADGRAVGRELFEELRRPVPTGIDGVGYGLGVFLVDLGDAGTLWGHDGYGGAFLYAWPEGDAAWAGTINQTESDSERLQEAVLDALTDP